MEDDILIVTTTVGSQADALALAKSVMAARLAACAQLDAPVLSIYRWQGNVQEETETRLTFKTTVQAEVALRAHVAADHPYDLPQLTSWRATASADYAAWVRGEVVVPAAA